MVWIESKSPLSTQALQWLLLSERFKYPNTSPLVKRQTYDGLFRAF